MMARCCPLRMVILCFLADSQRQRVSRHSHIYVTTSVAVLSCSHDVILGWVFLLSNDDTTEYFDGTLSISDSFSEDDDSAVLSYCLCIARGMGIPWFSAVPVIADTVSDLMHEIPEPNHQVFLE